MSGMLKTRPEVPASVSDATDRAMLPEGLQTARIVARKWGFWTVRDFFGTEWDITFGADGEAPSIVLGDEMDPEFVIVDYTQN